MNVPKLHHYVPQFYLDRFVDENGTLWAWDKTRDESFPTKSRQVAAETHFYRMKELEEAGQDPQVIERQLSELETHISLITDQWLAWLRDMEPGEKVTIPDINRSVVSLFIALQFLRTADVRDTLSRLSVELLSAEDKRRAHIALMRDSRTLEGISDRIRESIWVFARNVSKTPFITSDNPVAIRTCDHQQWLRVGILAEGAYLVYPLSPTVIMYCYEPKYWNALAAFDARLSPVKFSNKMVENDNSGQVFMSSRFVFSRMNQFDHARAVAKTPGTNI